MLRPLRTAAALLFLASAGGCGDGDDESDGADFYVHGAGVEVETDAPFARSPDLPARIEGVLAAALAYWGGSWDDLAGRRITILDGPYVPCGGASAAIGCYDGDLRISASDPGAGTFGCVEQTALVHEVGHAVIGDAPHSDPRWMAFDSLAAALAGRLGTTGEGEGDCVLAVSVWRHGPDGGPGAPGSLTAR
jgi:hypothetical protein